MKNLKLLLALILCSCALHGMHAALRMGKTMPALALWYWWSQSNNQSISLFPRSYFISEPSPLSTYYGCDNPYDAIGLFEDIYNGVPGHDGYYACKNRGSCNPFSPLWLFPRERGCYNYMEIETMLKKYGWSEDFLKSKEWKEYLRRCVHLRNYEQFLMGVEEYQGAYGIRESVTEIMNEKNALRKQAREEFMRQEYHHGGWR